MTARELAAYIEGLSPGRGAEEGFRFGAPDVAVAGVLVTWMATLLAIAAAATAGCNFLLAHEALLYPYKFADDRCLSWPVNAARLAALARHGLVLYRAHGMLDRHCILDDFRRQLGLPEPVVSEGCIRICEIEPATVADLARRTKAAVGLANVRVCGDPQRVVRRVGLPWGGLGLSVNVGFVEQLREHHPDVLIAGESDEYAMHFCRDAGMALIETSHVASENEGLRHFAAELQARFADLKVVFYDAGVPWQMI